MRCFPEWVATIAEANGLTFYRLVGEPAATAFGFESDDPIGSFEPEPSDLADKLALKFTHFIYNNDHFKIITSLIECIQGLK